MDCMIKEHYVVGDVVSPASIHIAQQEGARIPATPRSVRYRNTQTGEENAFVLLEDSVGPV